MAPHVRRPPPDQENIGGARWNPQGISAIYLSSTKAGAITEGDHAITVQPLRPRARRKVYAVDLSLERVVDLRSPEALEAVGLRVINIADDDHSTCREVGAAVSWLEYDGLLVPSARSDATNLIIYPANRSPEARYNFDEAEPVE